MSNKTTPQMLELATERCKSLHERFTRQRQQAFRLLVEASHPLTAYQLLELLRHEAPGAQPPTVYRALDFLQRTGLVHRIDATNRFVPCVLGCVASAPPPQLLVCDHCGEVEEAPMPDELWRRLLAEAGTLNFSLSVRPVALTGVCRGCQNGN